MSAAANMALAREFMERAFNQGDLSVIDEQHSADTIDHQEPLGTDFIIHRETSGHRAADRLP